MINMMVARVPGRRDCPNLQRPNSDRLVIFQNLDASGRNGREFSPQTLHLVTENARSRFNQLCRVDQMRRTARMDINLRAGAGSEAPRRSGVIKMDVTQKNMSNVVCIEANFLEFVGYVVEG